MDDKAIARQIALINSMTKKERANPDMLQASRKKRIAAGAGMDVSDLNKLLKMQKQMADTMKKLGKMGKGGMLKQAMRAMTGKGGGLPLTQKDADSRALQLDSAAELAAVKTLPAEEAERLGVSESAPVAETAQRYYAALLQSRLRTLFECKKQNVYIETQTAFITVYKASAEHALVLSAGGYDVAGKRMENDLAVDGGWVQRKNPDFIVKFVAASALNGDTLGELLARDGLRETAAAKNGRALLLCESMTDAPQLQTAAALCLAKAMYPDLFADIDAAQAVGQLADEAGAQTGGPWFYPAI